MNSALQCTIPANPDITGIGIRVSIYAQAALAVLIIVIVCIDRQITEREKRVLTEFHGALRTTFFSLLIVSYIEIILAKLSLFHALVVLNLARIDSVIVAVLFRVGSLSESQSSRPSPSPSDFFLFVASAFLSPVLGIYVWVVLPNWTSNWTNDCTSLASFSLLGIRLSFANRALRIASIAFYAMVAAVGFLFVLLTCLCATMKINLNIYLTLDRPVITVTRRRLSGNPDENRRSMADENRRSMAGENRGFMVDENRRSMADENRCSMVDENRRSMAAGASIPFIFMEFLLALAFFSTSMLDTERMITWNASFLQAEEHEWSFGQVVAIVLLVGPTWVAIKEGRNAWKEWREKR